jgi:uncharacterized membrane protein required for colicin V production
LIGIADGGSVKSIVVLVVELFVIISIYRGLILESFELGNL